MKHYSGKLLSKSYPCPFLLLILSLFFFFFPIFHFFFYFFIAVGDPIAVTKVDNPTPDQLDDLHATYIEKLKQLFEDHKAEYNVPESTELIIY